MESAEVVLRAVIVQELLQDAVVANAEATVVVAVDIREETEMRTKKAVSAVVVVVIKEIATATKMVVNAVVVVVIKETATATKMVANAVVVVVIKETATATKRVANAVVVVAIKETVTATKKVVNAVVVEGSEVVTKKVAWVEAVEDTKDPVTVVNMEKETAAEDVVDVAEATVYPQDLSMVQMEPHCEKAVRSGHTQKVFMI
jgi:hypothetical protein